MLSGKSFFLLYLFHPGIDHAVTHPDPQALPCFYLGHGTDIFPIGILHIGKTTV